MTDCLEKEINSVIEKEKQQGKPSYVEQTRQRLMAFIEQIKSAIAVLTGGFVGAL